MAERILYVYAEPREENPSENTNVVETVEGGKVIRREVGLIDGVIGLRVLEAWVQNYYDIRFDRSPDGKAPSIQLDTGLLSKLYSNMPTLTIQ